MSQKENKFQSKSKKFGEGGKGRGKPAGRGFGKKFEGDRGERPARGSKSFGGGADRDAPRSRADGDYRPRKPRAEGGDSRGGDRPFRDKKPYEKKFGDKPRRDFGDRPPRGDRDDRPRSDRPRSDRPRRDFGDKPRRDFGDKKFGDKPRRDFGDRPPRGDRDDRPRSDRPRSDRPRRDFGDKPRRDFGDKKFGDKPRRDFGDRPPRGDRDDRPRSDRPRRDYNDRPQKRFDREPEQDFAPRAEATPETRQRLKSDRPGYGAPSSAYLYGAHAVRAALGNPKRVHQRLLVTTSGYEAIQEAYEDAQAEGLRLPQPMYVESIDIERLLPRDAVHQGILLDSQPAEEVFLQDILIAAPADAKIVVLDQVTDPHNVGAILRSASAFGAYAVVMQRLNAPDITGTLAKTASGAAEYVPIVREVNLSRALEQLKEAGFFCIGLDERGKQTIAEAAPKGRVALVMGAEGDGLRRLVGENCDVLAKLPTQGPIASLNVSNAAAVALYEVIRNG